MQSLTLRLLLALSIMSAAVACDDDDTTGDDTTGDDTTGDDDAGDDASCSAMNFLADAGPACERTGESVCPVTGSPGPCNQAGACCYRTENSGDRAANPEFRLAAVVMETPSTLAAGAVTNLLSTAFNEERFNWLIRVEGADADGDVVITTGFGNRSNDGTYAFVSGIAPTCSGAADRWDPVTLMGHLTGDTITTDVQTEAFTVPVFAETGELSIELPLQSLKLEHMDMTENRSCIGSRLPTSFDVDAGQLTAFMTVEAADGGNVALAPGFTPTLCELITGAPGSCADNPDRTGWDASLPDSLCGDEGCEKNADDMSDVCDPLTTCNAWQLVGNFAAQGVDITD